jgi:hypothetical protein
MINQSNQQNEQVAQSDPMLLLAKLLIKIDKREKVIEKLQEGEAKDESDKRSADSTSQSQ